MNRREFIRSMVPLASALALSTQCRAGTVTEQGSEDEIDVVEAFGFVPDGRTDNYDAFHRWVAHANRQGGGRYVFRPGTYYVHRHRGGARIAGGAGQASNAVFFHCDGLLIAGVGARIRLNGAFHRRDLSTATFMPLVFERCRNVRISGFEIDGGVREMVRDPSVSEAYSHLVALHGCRDVILENLNLHHSQTDAIYLASGRGNGSTGKPTVASRDVTLRNVTASNNARGGLGIIQVYGLNCTDCAFNESGFGLGRYQGHAPQFGATVEPDYLLPADVDVRTGNIEFRRCTFRDNSTAFSGVYSDRVQGYLRVIDCTSSNRFGSRYHAMLNWPGALIQGGRHDSGAGTIWASWDGPAGGDLEIRDCEIRTSGVYGVFHPHHGNLLRMSGVRIIGTHRGPAAPHGWILAVQGDPGRGRRNHVADCEVFVPAARKAKGPSYQYIVSLAHTVSERNLFRTDLYSAGGEHFCTEYGVGAIARGDRYQGTAPGVTGSFRPWHGADHDTRRPFSKP